MSESHPVAAQPDTGVSPKEDTLARTKPHVVIGVSWVFTWVRQLYFLSDTNPLVREFNAYFATAETIQERDQKLESLVRAFFNYFLKQGHIADLQAFRFDQLGALFGEGTGGPTLPLREYLATMTERDRHMFTALTVDVFLAICNPIVAAELGLEFSQQDAYLAQHLSRPANEASTS